MGQKETSSFQKSLRLFGDHWNLLSFRQKSLSEFRGNLPVPMADKIRIPYSFISLSGDEFGCLLICLEEDFVFFPCLLALSPKLQDNVRFSDREIRTGEGLAVSGSDLFGAKGGIAQECDLLQHDSSFYGI